ncbi:carboxy-processing protease [Peptoniphilus sp. ING2-D1G]|nr:carboxy-processing protease [Peptoniphilus sp. ING2-D1G]
MKKKLLKILGVIALILITNTLTAVSLIYGYSNSQVSSAIKIKYLEDFVKKNYLYEVKDEDLEVGKLKGIVAALNDPYSEYYTKEEYQELMEMTTGKFFGIGVVITRGEDNLITVISPIKGSPADKAGIKAKDKIIKVEGVEYTGEDINEATKIMKGEKGTEVTITIYRPDTAKTKEITLIRDEISVETIISDKLGEIGYIGITGFDENTAEDFNEALDKLLSQKIKSLIIDLRGNPGGIVDSAAEICDRILPEGMIVYAENREKKRVFEFKSDEKHLNIPLAVLVNEGSASASEIVAGAIRDYKAGTIIGQKTFGKGIVQTAKMFPSGDGIKLTTSEYFTPKGENIHKKGIKPDIEVKLPDDIEGMGIEYKDTDTQLQKAIEVLKEKS